MKKHSTKIISVTPYICGHRTYSKADTPKHQKLVLPEWVFRIEHKQLGNILFNSGYSRFISPFNPKTILFKRCHKIAYTPSENLSVQLSSEGMDEQCIRRIVLSHAALDSIGGLPNFSNYTLYATAQALASLNTSLFNEYIPKRLVPPNSIFRKPLALFNEKTVLKNYFSYIYDLFGDGSVLGVALNGYAKGHIGLFLPEQQILLAAHACINTEHLNTEPTKHFLKQQYNSDQYLNTLNNLRRFLADNPDVRCIFANEPQIQNL
ncbi:MAG: hypothetical protein ACI4M3_07370 [Acutalibacteraceae bacterium]